jgi:hypothetical protein
MGAYCIGGGAALSTDGLRNPEKSRTWTPAFVGVTNNSFLVVPAKLVPRL